MRKREQVPPALKHGAYSGITLLPGEDPDAFNKLHSDLIGEFAPSGPLEEDIVESLARLMWRKQNLSTYRIARQAKSRYSKIRDELLPAAYELPTLGGLGPDELRAANRAAEERARKELGPAWQLVEIGEIAEADHLLDELLLVDRLDGMIDRCLKRLLFVRGLKSLSASSSATPPRKKLSAA